MALLGNLTGSSQFFNDTAFYNGAVSSSLRMQDARLTETPSSTGNSKKWTFSAWIKRGTLADSYIFAGTPYDGYNGIAAIYFTSAGQLHTYYDTSGANPYGAVGPRLFRDTSSWYHLVWAVDAANTIHKIWINNELVSTDTGKYPPNYDYGINRSGSEMVIGDGAWDSYGSTNFNGYMAEINHCDGQYLEPDSFGETKNGIWIPLKDPSLTYGTNGFRLQFLQTGTSANSSGIGADTSGQANHFAVNALAASDVVPDSPENNFCTMNPLHFRASYGMATLSEGILAYGDAGLSSSWGAQFSTFNLNSGKWYAEVLTKGNSSCSIGVMNVGHYGYQHFLVQNPQNETGNWTLFMDGTDTKSRLNGSLADPTYTAFNNDQVLGIALNADDKELSFYVDGTLQTGLGSSGVIDISTGGSSNDAWSFTANTANGSGVTFVWNFGQDSSFAGDETATSNSDANSNGTFHTAPPSGYLAVCSANLPEPTIGPNSATQADDHFNTLIYDGNDDATRTFDVGFVSDWSWFKARNASGIGHQLYDSSRGVTKFLASNTNGAEDTNTEGVTSFNSSGLLAIGNSNFLNKSGRTHVLWNWKANGGTTSSNTDGSITSTVQANTTAGFSIVTATSPSSGTWSVGHGLSKKPDMIIQKYRSGTGRWTTWHNILTSGQYLGLNETNAVASSGTPFNFTITDSVIGGNADYDNTSQTVVYYVFHNVEGYSRIGSYSGNGNEDGTFVYLGFRPAFIMLKCKDNVSSWNILDNKRDPDNTVNQYILPSSSDAEGSLVQADFLSNGIKFRTTNAERNGTRVILYMAFAEAPFKYANAR